MGLDMYLEARTYISGYEWDTPENQAKVDRIISEMGFSRTEIQRPSLTISLPVGYWRKANQIHNWFVQNVQKGEDDCGDYYVSEENLTALKDVCEKVIKDQTLAGELLPTSSGFFFGSTDYDEWYVRDLQETIDIVNRCLGDSKLSGASFYYSSSW